MNVEQLKEHIKQESIVHIIERYIPLSKKGANWEAVCPFHSDTNPSLKVSESKSLYKCFVCGAAGDAIKFVQDYKRLDFIETLEEIAQTLGVNFEKTNSKESPKIQMGQRVLKVTNKLFQSYSKNKSFSHIYQNFLQKRKLKPETASEFQIGFAPPGNQLLKYLEKLPDQHKSFALKIAQEIQVTKMGKTGPYDSFRSRISFPIWNRGGKVIGFGSRSITDEQMPKYLNSSESFLFQKRNVLYPYHLAKSSIREKKSVILVEGYMDAISLHQAGFKNTLAIMGIALSESSIEFLKKQVKRFYLCLDNDNAGLRASTQINQLMIKQGILPLYIDLGDHKDPDDFINEEGSLEFQKRMDEARAFLDKEIDELIPHEKIQSSEARLNLFKEIIQLLSPLAMDLSATERVLSVAKRLSLQSPAETLIDIYKAQLNAPAPKKAFIQPQERDIPPLSIENHENFMESESFELKNQIESKTDRFITKTILQKPELLTHIAVNQVIDFTMHSEVKDLLVWVDKVYPEIEESEYKSIMMNYVHGLPNDSALSDIISDSLYGLRQEKFSKEILSKFAKDFLKKIEIKSLKEKLPPLRKLHRETMAENEAQEIEKKIDEINKRINELNI